MTTKGDGMRTRASGAEGARSGARVRPARPDDLEVLVRFNLAMARETEALELDPATVRAGVSAILGSPDLGRVFVIEDGGAPVAVLALTLEWSDWRNGTFWWIQNVYVDPDHRRRGHYRRLHEHVRALAARDPRVCGLRLYVERNNRNARTTYEQLGMKETEYRLYEEATRERD